MRCRNIEILGLGTALAAALFATTDASAGQFKRLDATASLGVGGQVTAWANPQNHNIAMEMDTYEFLSASGNWRCRILFNNTGTGLHLSLVGLTGTVLQSCTTPVNGTCDTPDIGLGGDFLFQCIVASGAGSPVGANSLYQIGIQRTGAFAPITAGPVRVRPNGTLSGGVGASDEPR
jgi:hypothetical protein